MFEIGNSLREARLRQRLDFPEVESRTKIRGKYLRALEEEQFETLPAQTYVRGFLRTYAESLGLDGQLYVDEYNSRFVAGDDEHPVRPRRSSAPRPRHHRRFEANVVLLALVAIALVTALVIAAWRYGGGSTHRTQAGSAPGSKAAARPAVPSGLARLVVTASRGSSLLEVHAGSAGGRLLYHGTLEPGQQQRFVGRQLWLDIGTPESLSFRLNGRPVRLGGGAPRVVIVTAKQVRAAGTGA